MPVPGKTTDAYLVSCPKCARLWRPNPSRYLVPCCNEPPNVIGPGYTARPRLPAVPWSGDLPRPVGLRIRRYLKEVGPVPQEMIDHAEERGWLIVKRPVWWPIQRS